MYKVNRKTSFKHKSNTKGILYTVMWIAVSALLAIVPLSTVQAQPEQKKSFILATATTGGTYYPVGVALATLTKVKLEPLTGISLSAISSAGTAENVKMMRKEEAQFALLQGLYTAWAWNGTDRFETEGKQTYLRTITMLWDNVEHVLLKSDLVSSGTVADLRDLKGHKFSIASRNSGAEVSNRHILEALGVELGANINPVHQGYGPSADSLQDGRIVGLSIPGGAPLSAITRAMAARGSKVTLLSFTDTQLASINKKYPLWHRATITAGTYPGQDEDIASIAHANVLAVHENVAPEIVYQITKSIYENLDFLVNIHPAVKELSLDRAITDLPAPLHDGAVRFYEERGITIPDQLRSTQSSFSTEKQSEQIKSEEDSKAE